MQNNMVRGGGRKNGRLGKKIIIRSSGVKIKKGEKKGGK